jgi:hypothetical protein
MARNPTSGVSLTSVAMGHCTKSQATIYGRPVELGYLARPPPTVPSASRCAALSEGAYLPRSHIADGSDQQLWKACIQLTHAEAAFRIQKDQLNVRPIWHQRENRVQAHILVCFLAFVLWKSLEMWQQRAGLGNSPRTILEELARTQSHERRAAHRNARPDPSALCHSPGPRPGCAPRSPRHRPAQAHAHRPSTRRHRLNTQLQRKCSGDFSAKILICLWPTVEFAQVGLT